uniref:IgGFc-binding protein N-terminal domain-containing protein n=1 Tax=Biomphalaria glabrata TaxID=6526 RepID=A0A2C9LBM0_BIOGL
MTKQIKVTSKMKHEKIGIFNSVHIGTNGNVSVLVINNGLTRDGFMAIPIEAFGMVYTVVTLVGQPVFHVLSSTDDTEVLIQFNDWSALEYGRRAEFVLTFGKKRILPKSIIMVTIKKRYQYFQIHDCGSDKYGKTDFTGTLL